MARADLIAVLGQLRRVIVHLLELEYSPAPLLRLRWLNAVDPARCEVQYRLTASMRSHVEAEISETYRVARRIARRELAQLHEEQAAESLPMSCPYSLDELVQDAWYPPNRHGLQDCL